MLNKYFKYDEETGMVTFNKNSNGNNSNKIFKIIGIICLATIIIVMFSNSFYMIEPYLNGNENEASKEDENVFSKIDNNYDMKVIVTENDITNTLNYSRDANIVSYEANTYEMISLIEYNAEIYRINADMSLEKVNENELDKVFDKAFYDISMIKSIVDRADADPSSSNKYSLKLSDYFKEYNYKYKTNIIVENDKDIELEIKKYENGAHLKIDYSDIYNLIYNEVKSIIYNIEITNIGKNNYDNIIKVIEGDF